MTTDLFLHTQHSLRERKRVITGERGSITPVVLIWFAFSVLSILGVARTGEKLASRQHVQHGADAVALAWVSVGSDMAERLAQIYNVQITQSEVGNGRVRVWVQRGDHNASATAQYTQ